MKNTFVLLLLSLSACGQQLDGDGDGFDELTGDCNDDDPNIGPAAIEICDGIDNDCNGETDEFGAKGGTIFYVDLDGDGHGSENGTLEACSVPDGYSTSKRDCDESLSEVNPDADEICDGIDNDCDTHIDEYTAVDAPTWYPDRDGDGYGDMEAGILGCEAPPDHLLDGSDCDDVDPGVNPAANEDCATPLDDDCTESANDIGAIGCTNFYGDLDGDGYGGTEACLCFAEGDYTEDIGGDCNDQDSNIHPGAEEVVDFIDNDCQNGADYPLTDADVHLRLPNSNTYVYQTAIGNFDGDEHADIVVSDPSNSIHLIFGSEIASGDVNDYGIVIEDDSHGGTGNPWTASKYSIVNWDSNADGMDDLILYTKSSDASYGNFLLFTAPFTQDLALSEAATLLSMDYNYAQLLNPVGDLNGDGLEDVVVLDRYGDLDQTSGFIGGLNNVGQISIFYAPVGDG